MSNDNTDDNGKNVETVVSLFGNSKDTNPVTDTERTEGIKYVLEQATEASENASGVLSIVFLDGDNDAGVFYAGDTNSTFVLGMLERVKDLFKEGQTF